VYEEIVDEMRCGVVRCMGLRRKSDSLVRGEKSGQRAIMHEVSSIEWWNAWSVAGAVIR
jgi:hypothetical protein